MEGYKKGSVPKIEVYQCQPDLRPLAADDEDIFAIVSDKPFDHALCPGLPGSLPTFLRDQVEQISVFVMEKLLLVAGLNPSALGRKRQSHGARLSGQQKPDGVRSPASISSRPSANE